MTKTHIGLLLGGITLIMCIGLVFLFRTRLTPVSVSPTSTPVPTPLLVYSFEHLKETSFESSQIELGDVVKSSADFTSQLFSFSFRPNPSQQETKRVTGLMNIPTQPGSYPVIVMLRGYIPLASYVPGAGSQPSASVFARHGFITIAPDFLSYGESDQRADEPYEARLQSYTTTLSLFASLSTLNEALEASFSGTMSANLKKVGMWGHSNGGHIALSSLAISGKSYPTVLWAPVSKPFPYSLLSYTDEDEDHGKAARKALADFEKIYDVEKFSPPNYYKWITAPVLIHQGKNDEEVPVWWSDELVKSLKENKIDVTYRVYDNADHNLSPDGWTPAVLESIEFFTKYFALK